MDIELVTQLIGSLGFPIVCVLGMGWFISDNVKREAAENKEAMENMSKRCQEREDKLYHEIEKNREINEKAISTIALYADRLDIIQRDISDIKTDITVIKSNGI